MKRLIFPVLLLLAFGLGTISGCSDSLDRYRYPCQNPANWGTSECEPPACAASQTCTDDLITKETAP